MKFGSVCSGIEAASTAWNPIGWEAAWFAEIEPFPCAVLKHHFPDVPNLGDMTTIATRILTGEVEAPDVFTGGTPCQAFSVAGLRQSLSDDRGNLSLKFVEIADAIDHIRGIRGDDPAIIIWENVPGVLSTKDNAFGCFLGELAGESVPLDAPGGKWSNAGCVYGPQRAVAWRTLDAQFFGVAQRRRRVFVVASARDGFDPAAVLFEWDGVRRDTAPSREARQVDPTIPARSTAGGGFPGTDGATGGHVVAPPAWPKVFGGNNTSGPIDVAPARNACASASGRMDFESEAFIVHATQDPCVSSDTAFALGRNSGQENAVFAIQAGALRTNPLSGPDGIGVQADHAYTLEARAEVQAVAFAENSRAELRLEGGDGSRCGALSTGGGKPWQGVPMVATTARIRRITPLEAERLMGFPDNYTAIPWRGKPADQCPDGPRYKALGNSWAVPVVRWIGERINQVEAIK